MWKVLHVLFSYMVIVGLVLGGIVVTEAMKPGLHDIGVMGCVVWGVICVWQCAWSDMKDVYNAIRNA